MFKPLAYFKLAAPLRAAETAFPLITGFFPPNSRRARREVWRERRLRRTDLRRLRNASRRIAAELERSSAAVMSGSP
ncbi:MAG: hypothetical protein KKH28_08035 [Elusimicrobia bacterium]|nr:hypothetical protein [Elusimicrobiota bacterium]